MLFLLYILFIYHIKLFYKSNTIIFSLNFLFEFRKFDPYLHMEIVMCDIWSKNNSQNIILWECYILSETKHEVNF